VLGEDGLSILVGMFLDVFFESQELISPLWYDHGSDVVSEVFEIIHSLVYGIGI